MMDQSLNDKHTEAWIALALMKARSLKSLKSLITGEKEQIFIIYYNLEKLNNIRWVCLSLKMIIEYLIVELS